MNLPNLPICLITFVSATIAIHVMLRRNKTSIKNDLNKYMQREKTAENTIKRNFSDFPYIYPDKSFLPIKQYYDNEKYKKVIKKQNTCLKKSELEMIYFDELYSNTDLKLKYGKNNLDKITYLEEHYNGYIKSLLDWAKELIALDNLSDARLVLEEAVRMKSDISRTYILLADIYENDKKSLLSLKEKTQEIRIHLKEKVIEYIDAKLNETVIR